MTITQRIIGGLRTPSAPVVVASGDRSMPANPSARYFAFPVATVLSDGRVLVAWQDNDTHFGGQGSGGRFALIDATGTTWGDSTVLVPEPNSDTRWWAPVGIARRPGRVAILQTVNDSPRRGFIQVTTDPTTWPTPTVEITWAQAGVMPCHLAWIEDGTTNGRMLATAYSGAAVVISASGDNGATWEHWSQVTTGGDGFSESTITVTARGDLLMLQRCDSGPNADTIHARWSSDHGRTWSAPVPVIRAASGMPTCTLLPDGRLVATIRDKGRPVYEPWSLAWSSDHGATWQVTPVTDDWMMYGQVVVKADGGLLLVGGSQWRTSSSDADVWARTLRLRVPALEGRPDVAVERRWSGVRFGSSSQEVGIPSGAVVHTNRVSNPRPQVDLSGWTQITGAAPGAADFTRVTDVVPGFGPHLSGFARSQYTVAPAAGGVSAVMGPTAPVTAGETVPIVALGRSNRVAALQLFAQFYNGQTWLSNVSLGASREVAGWTWATLTSSVDIPAGVTGIRIGVRLAGTSAIPEVGQTIDVAGVGVGTSEYFDGDFADDWTRD